MRTRTFGGGGGSLSFLLKTEVYCLFRMLALPCAFETRVPSDFNAGMPQVLTLVLNQRKSNHGMLLYNYDIPVGLLTSLSTPSEHCHPRVTGANTSSP